MTSTSDAVACTPRRRRERRGERLAQLGFATAVGIAEPGVRGRPQRTPERATPGGAERAVERGQRGAEIELRRARDGRAAGRGRGLAGRRGARRRAASGGCVGWPRGAARLAAPHCGAARLAAPHCGAARALAAALRSRAARRPGRERPSAAPRQQVALGDELCVGLDDDAARDAELRRQRPRRRQPCSRRETADRDRAARCSQRARSEPPGAAVRSRCRSTWPSITDDNVALEAEPVGRSVNGNERLASLSACPRPPCARARRLRARDDRRDPRRGDRLPCRLRRSTISRTSSRRCTRASATSSTSTAPRPAG